MRLTFNKCKKIFCLLMSYCLLFQTVWGGEISSHYQRYFSSAESSDSDSDSNSNSNLAMNFAPYYKLKEGSLHSVKDPLAFERFYALATLATTVIGDCIVPPGIGLDGLVEIASGTVSMRRAIRGLNKVAKQYNHDKAIVLAPYIGKEMGPRELLFSYLRAEQTVFDKDKGHFVGIKVLNGDERISRGVTPNKVRDLVHHFIQRIQIKGRCLDHSLIKAEGEQYEEALDDFLRAMGFVVFTKQTLTVLKNRLNVYLEDNLYKGLYQQNILTYHGSLKGHRILQSFPVSTKKIEKALSEMGIREEESQRLVIHDLGMVTDYDIDSFSQSEMFRGLFNEQSPLTAFSKKHLAKRKDLFIKSLHQLTKRYYRKEEALSLTLDNIILSSLVNKDEVKAYQKKHDVHPEKEYGDDKLMIKKLAYLQHLSAHHHDYNYFDLDSEVKVIREACVKYFDSLHIQNENFQILALKGVDIATTSLSYIEGVGFVTFGAFETLLLLVPTVISSAVTIALGTAGVGGLAVGGAACALLNSILFYQSFKSFVLLRTNSKVLSLLVAHLESLDPTTLSATELKSLATKNFQVLSQKYVNKLKKKMYLDRMGLLQGVMAITGASYAYVGVHLLLALWGVGFFVTTAVPANLFVLTGIYVATTLPLALFLMHEVRLEEKVMMAEKALTFYNELLANENSDDLGEGDHLSEKQSKFLKLFMQETKELIKFGIHHFELINKQEGMSLSRDVNQIESLMVSGYGARKLAIHHIKRLVKKSESVKKDIYEMVSDELKHGGRSKIDINKFMGYLTPSYYVNRIDIIMKAVTPGKINGEKKLIKNYYEVPSTTSDWNDYSQEVTLGRIFTFANAMYNNFQSNLYEFTYLSSKQRLQELYFDTSIKQSEWEELSSRMKGRQSEIEDLYSAVGGFRDEMATLDEIHQKEVDEGNVLFPWDPPLFDQINEMSSFDKKLIEKSQKISSQRGEVVDLKLPEMGALIRFLELFRPVNDIR